MTSILLVGSNGSIKSLKAKDLTVESLYKKCGFRTNDNFAERYRWTLHHDTTGPLTVAVYAKDAGTANNENKYDLPPPIDKALYFGTLAIVRFQNVNGHELADLTEADWKQAYNTLFGGFEDLCDDEQSSVDELDAVPASMKTENGYLKDDFVVDNDMEISQGSASTSSEEAQFSSTEGEDDTKPATATATTTATAPVRKRKKTTSANPVKKTTAAVKKPAAKKSPPAEPPVRHVEQELREAAYVFTDDE